MTSHFLDTSGHTFSIHCLHDFYTFKNPLLHNEKVPACPHSWGVMFSDVGSNGVMTATVTSQSNRMLQDGYKRQKLFHIPLPPPGPPGSGEFAQLKKLFRESFSQPALRTSTVSGEGLPLTATLRWVIGISMTCGGPGDILQQNTVKTTPTKGDYADVVLDFLLPWLEKQGKELLKAIARRLLKQLVNNLAKRNIWTFLIADYIESFLNKLSDKAIDFVVDKLSKFVHKHLPPLIDKVDDLRQQEVLQTAQTRATSMLKAAQSVQQSRPTPSQSTSVAALEGWVDGLL